MTALIYTLGVVLFFLGVLASIALHEVGHMYPAKKFGVKVTQYMVGFGRTVWSRKKGDTEYGVKLIPMGGYIRMVGMLPPSKLDEHGHPTGIHGGFFGRLIADARAAETEEMQATDESRHFYRKKSWQKIVIMAGGPMMNVVLAVLILGGVFMGIGVRQPTLEVADVSDCVIPASEGVRACNPPGSDNPDPVSPAREAGFQVGDEVLSFNGQPMSDWDEFSAAVRANQDRSARVVVERDGQQVTLTTHTMVSERPTTDGDGFVQVGFLGITPDETLQRQDAGFVVATMWDYTKRTGDALTELPSRMVGVAKSAVGVQERDPESPMSIVGASRVAGEVASTNEIGAGDRLALMLTLLGVVNLFVALFNFIPLLPLDGGHIAGAVYEAARRGWARLRGKPDPGYADVAQMLPVAYAAASVLIVMGALLIWADIVNPIRLSG